MAARQRIPRQIFPFRMHHGLMRLLAIPEAWQYDQEAFGAFWTVWGPSNRPGFHESIRNQLKPFSNGSNGRNK